jgi:hypothetical protein
MLRHRSVTTVFCLDGEFVKYARSRLRNWQKLKHLPDPVLYPASPLEIQAPPHWLHALPQTRTCFALFGALDDRKGILQTLDAIRLMGADITQQCSVVLAGRIDETIKRTFYRQLECVRATVPTIWIHVEDRYLESEEIICLLKVADVVLAPYQSFLGSSGVLYWAIGAGRPVITQDYGLVGALTRKHRLGLAVDTRKPSEIAEAMKACVGRAPQELCDLTAMRRLSELHTPAVFAETILRDPSIMEASETRTESRGNRA